MLDVRWLVATVASVFLALGIGILIGAALPGGGPLVERQAAAIGRLERELGQLRADERAAREEQVAMQKALTAQRDFAAAAVPWIVADRLSSHRVAVVVSGTAGPELGGLLQTLALAGAQTFAVVVAVDLLPASDAARAAVASRWSGDVADLAGLARLVAAHLAAAVATGDPAGDLPFLASLGLVQVAGKVFGPPTDVILFGGSRLGGQAEVLFAAVLRAVRAAGAQVAGAEEADSSPSLLPAFERWGLSVVDDADQPAGQAALALVLAGHGGHFGFKAGTRGALPARSAP